MGEDRGGGESHRTRNPVLDVIASCILREAISVTAEAVKAIEHEAHKVSRREIVVPVKAVRADLTGMKGMKGIVNQPKDQRPKKQ